MTSLEAAAAPARTADRGHAERISAAAGSTRSARRLRAAPAGTTRTPAWTTRLSRLSGLTAAAGATRSARLSAAARAARLQRNEVEYPLVVVVASEVEADRFALALAADAHHAAGDRTAADGASLLCPGGLAEPGGRRPGNCAAAAPGLARLTRLTGPPLRPRLPRGPRGPQVLELVVGDGILELLAQVMPLHQHVNAGRQGLRPGLEETNRADVLLAAEDELRFLLALRLVAPHRQGGGHQHCHHGQRHQQGRHRVAFFAAAHRTALTP